MPRDTPDVPENVRDKLRNPAGVQYGTPYSRPKRAGSTPYNNDLHLRTSQRFFPYAGLTRQ